MDNFEENRVLDQVPVLYVRGTHYEVGLSVGRTFKSIHQETFANWDIFNNVIMKNYCSDEGNKIYEDTLRLCENKFPLYVEELKGMAEGAGLPFHKIFSAHIDSLMVPPPEDTKNKQIQADSGCTSILCNDSETILAQNEDGFPEHVNQIYVIVADIVDKCGNRMEKFAALSYPGMLTGLAMGFNSKGVAFTVNTLVPKETFVNGTPRFFVTRALLGAANHEEVMQIVSDKGVGVGDGFSINICYFNKENVSDKPTMYNIEVAPPAIDDKKQSAQKSQVSARAVPYGESYVHCNKYLHLPVPEIDESLISSINRHEAISKLPVPSSVQLIKNALSDQSNHAYPVYRRCQYGGNDGVKTVATGIFDMKKMEWSIYINIPATSDATVIIPMHL